MFNFLVKYAVGMFFMAFLICINIPFFFLHPIGPFVPHSMRPKGKRVRPRMQGRTLDTSLHGLHSFQRLLTFRHNIELHLRLSEMYPGFQIWVSSGPLLEKFGVHCKLLEVQLINIQEYTCI